MERVLRYALTDNFPVFFNIKTFGPHPPILPLWAPLNRFRRKNAQRPTSTILRVWVGANERSPNQPFFVCHTMSPTKHITKTKVISSCHSCKVTFCTGNSLKKSFFLRDLESAKVPAELRIIHSQTWKYFSIVLGLIFSILSWCQSVHYTQNDYRTELYYFRIIFGNSCSVITEPNRFWNCLVSVTSVSRAISVIWVEELPNRFEYF